MKKISLCLLEKQRNILKTPRYKTTYKQLVVLWIGFGSVKNQFKKLLGHLSISFFGYPVFGIEYSSPRTSFWLARLTKMMSRQKIEEIFFFSHDNISNTNKFVLQNLNKCVILTEDERFTPETFHVFKFFTVNHF